MDKYQFVTPESVETRIKGELKKGKEKLEILDEYTEVVENLGQVSVLL